MFTTQQVIEQFFHEVFFCCSNIKEFTTEKTYMQLNAACLRNLEIFQNLTDGKETGSLFSVLDRTRTKFGCRLLKQWLGKPLLDVKYEYYFFI